MSRNDQQPPDSWVFKNLNKNYVVSSSCLLITLFFHSFNSFVKYFKFSFNPNFIFKILTQELQNFEETIRTYKVN